ncbi:Dihydropteroate synthase [Haemophilus influenzae]|nr:Dihydropteroate synthase [Haemophilus influenzae]
MIGAVLDKPVDQRIIGSAAGALIAVQKGAKILRVHDVAATSDMLKVWQATENA